MQLILTHDQADFDAIASQLGASLTHENFTPVLPPRLNRNVRAFLNLYGTELPFIEQQDLTGEPIRTILLVDTQSLVTVKGMKRNTSIRVIDHHQHRMDTYPDWQFSLDKTGACTTLFVEHLHEHHNSLNPVQATLLLLGIYEDTGSLTYASTTSRDIRASAFLLDQGASLKISANFLNPPLSPDQRILYDRLLETASSHRVHGYTVVIATGHAEFMNEEISTIVHKLRDLLDPDALFVLATTRDGVRMIARSTNDRIDVARIAREFGGGGHERASAALIHPSGDANPESLNQLMEESATRLKEILPSMIQPSIRVRKIMSRQPLLISPSTSTEEALNLMQRYGYEGYPVVDKGRVVGLLTRRAVDRAISHRLNLPTSSLMDAGEVTVSPDDPIEHLQDVMTSTGWGQIPVVDPDHKQVIGIVTRTDLLKTLRQGESSLPGHINLSRKLEESLSPARMTLIEIIMEAAEKKHLPIYIVGGFVRDLLLGRPCEDFDVVVEGDAIHLAHSLSHQFGGRVVSHNRFGTAKWQIRDISSKLADHHKTEPNFDINDLPESLDFISARTEFYEYPTALPTVEHSSIKLDLHRRDFTINTMALRLNGRHHGELYDFWGGLSDLRQKRIRVLHSLSFVDDPTRMLRAARFEQRFQFHIETRTLELIKEAHDLMRQVSGDRIRHEFNLIFQENSPVNVFRRLEELNLFDAIIPGFHWSKEQNRDWKSLFESGPLQNQTLRQPIYLWLTLFHRIDEEQRGTAIERLKLPSGVVSVLESAAELTSHLDDLPKMDIPEAVRLLDTIPEEAVTAILAFEPDSPGTLVIQKYRAKWKHIKPNITGRDLEKMGVVRGPVYRTILDTLRAELLAGHITNRDEEEQFVKELIKRYK